MASEMGELAAALNCLDPTADVRLLKVDYYFYHADGHQFLFAQKPPYPTSSMMTLEEMIRGDPFPKVESPLDERLKLAYKIAEAVFFLHTAGFLHKNITSSSIIAIRRLHPSPGEVVPDVDDSYLMGFDLIRGSEARTTREGAVKESEEPRSVWDFDVFQHPDRLQGASSPRYIKTYDVYSLGVLLLEVGFWEPLRTIAENLTRDDPAGWARELSELVPQLGARAGERYQSLVAWCLDLNGDHVVKDAEFVQEVLDPLEEIVNALSRENGSGV
jgi:serine/threonine protein kinase